MAVADVLVAMRARARSEAEKGAMFERMMRSAFRLDRTYRERFEEVWLWNDWPDRLGPDTGIDLVARTKEGRYVAIQCKCYAPDHTLTKGALLK